MTATVFVTGATGFIGSALCRRLADAGYGVRALVRTPSAVLRADVEQVLGDLDDAEALSRGVGGAVAVVHLAALLHVKAPSTALASRYETVNVEGTRRLSEQASEAGVGRFVLASTINVYGPSRGGPPWTEIDPTRPDTPYTESKLRAEAIVRALPGAVVLRLAAVYGPGMKGNYTTLTRALSRGLRVLPGDGANRRTLVHVDDAAQAFVEAVRSAQAGTYNVTDGHVYSLDAVVRSIQEATGRRPGVRYVPAAWLRATLAAPTSMSRVVGHRFDGTNLVDKLVEDVAASGEAFVDSSDYRPRVIRLTDGWPVDWRPR